MTSRGLSWPGYSALVNRPRRLSAAFTILELVLSLILVVALLAVLLPALAGARVSSFREQCRDHLRHFGGAWAVYLEEHGGSFPHVPVQPSWHYAGVRFSSVNDTPFLDQQRPLTNLVAGGLDEPERYAIFRCPADAGITGQTVGVGTGDRSAFRAFGTSYRANAPLFDARLAGLPDAHRGLQVDEIATAGSRLVVMGDPLWYEVYEGTGRAANWHGDPERANLLFHDGSVKFMRIVPKPRVGPMVFEPRLVPSGERER